MASEAFLAQLEDDSRKGPPPAGSVSGAAGGAACGDLARISLVCDRGRLTEVTFEAEGCAAARAATAAAAELCDGAEALAAARVGAAEIDRALGGLSPANAHAAGLAADALHRALAALAASGRRLALPPAEGERVLVALSGGVDSAVAALLERERGAEVVCVTLKLWADQATDGARACCSPEAVLGARRLAHSLDLAHLTLDLEEEFRRRVVGEFVAGYAAGRTPNPCVLCNGELRIAAMIDLADRVGAERLVTGHYARIVEDGEGPLLAPALNVAKDQSYMLAGLPVELLGRLSFPLAGLGKPRVRELAAAAGLAVAGKAESQDLCFLAGEGKRSFLQRHGRLRDRDGAVLDSAGHSLGRHRGHHHFTVGQRRGIGVAAAEPLYVLATDAESNSVTVGSRAELASDVVFVRDAVLHRAGARVDAIKLRFRSKALAAQVVQGAGEEGRSGELPAGRHERLELRLAEPAPKGAPGQTAVLISNDAIVGHATIIAS